MKKKNFFAKLMVSFLFANIAMANGISLNSENNSACTTVCINNKCENDCGSISVSSHSEKVLPRITTAFQFHQFTNIVSDIGNIKIEFGPKYSVNISATEESFLDLKVSQENKTLYISQKKNTIIKDNIDVDIIMPLLNSLSYDGRGDMIVTGFDQQGMFVQLNGVVNFRGKKNHIENLEVQLDGTVNADWLQSYVGNAHVKLDGVSKASMNFNLPNSVLTGEVSGVSQLTYCGKLDNQAKIDGVSKVLEIKC